MSLVKGSNSYVDLAEAVSYAGDRDGNDEWLAQSDALKEGQLVSAADLMETFIYVGTGTSDNLSWPRTATYWDPRTGVWETITNGTPVEIGHAQVELALDIFRNGNPGYEAGGGNEGPDSIKVGSIALSGLTEGNSSDFSIGKIVIPPIVMGLINHLLLENQPGRMGGLGQPYWRAW